MPKLKFSLPGDERYNTLMSIVALLQREGEIHIDDLAAHFGVPKPIMRGMLSTLNMTSFMPRNSEERFPFYIDVDRIDEEDGIVSLDYDEGPVGVPRISASQSVALIAGLDYLKSIPEFEGTDEIDELIELLSTDQSVAPKISIDASKFDEDLAVLQKAILTDRRITCTYVNGRGEQSEREIDPLLLVSSEDHWYLRGYCLKNGSIRTFRLDHMVKAGILPVSRSDEAIEAAKSLDETAPIYSPSDNDVEVTLELEPEAYPLAGLGDQIKEPTSADETIQITIKLGFLPDLGPLVCRYGTHVRVISPPEAREVVRKYAQQALEANYLNAEAE